MEPIGAGDAVSGPVALFFACLFSGLGIPLPEDIPLLVAGWQLRQGNLALPGSLVAAFAGVLARDFVAFNLGRWARRGSRCRWLRAYTTGPRFEGARRMAHRWGGAVLLGARLLAGFRVPLYFAAGFGGVQRRWFWGVEIPGLAVMVPCTLWLGWWLGESARQTVMRVVEEGRTGVLWVLGALAAVAVVAWLRAWWRRVHEDGVSSDA